MIEGVAENQNAFSFGEITADEDSLAEYEDFFTTTVQQTDGVYDTESTDEAMLLRTPEKLQEKVANNAIKVFICRNEKDQIVGSLEARIVTNPKKQEQRGNVVWILIEPSLRSKKVSAGTETIARMLNSQVEQYFKSRGCIGMVAGILDNNARSIAMHTAIGYKKDETIPAREGIGWYTKDF